MKKLICLLCVLLLCACNPGGDKPEAYDVADKTYYNTVDEYDNNEHSKAWFGKDGSFVMKDNFFDGYYEIVGKWSVSENVCTVEVENTPVGDFSKIIFEIQDDQTIVLKTTLAGSKADDVFSTTEVKGGGDSGNNSDNTPFEKILKTVENGYMIFYNTAQKGDNQSHLELIGIDGMIMLDRNDASVKEYDGVFKEEDGYLIVASTVPEYPFPDKMVGQRLFRIIDKDTLVLEQDFAVSAAGDVFSSSPNAPDADTFLYRHEPSDMTSDEYLPTVQFYHGVKDTFTFTENLFAGMGNIYGWFEETGSGYRCHVEDASQIQGFKGDDVQIIEFEKKDANTLVLKTDLCLSVAGDKFILVP